MINKLVIVKAIKRGKNELIPVWDPRIGYITNEEFGDSISIDGHESWITSFIDCVFNLETKELLFSEEIEIYPSVTQYSIGEIVYYKHDYDNRIEETKIVDIIYKDFEIEILKGHEIKNWFSKDIKNVEIHKELTYTLKKWKPIYVLENGTQTEWSHKLYKKYNK